MFHGRNVASLREEPYGNIEEVGYAYFAEFAQNLAQAKNGCDPCQEVVARLEECMKPLKTWFWNFAHTQNINCHDIFCGVKSVKAQSARQSAFLY